MLKTSDLVPYTRNAKKHDKKQIDNVAESIKQFGFAQPVVVDKDNNIIIGHCRTAAAKKLKIKEIPCIKYEDLSAEEANKLRLLDNKLNESDWDLELVAEDIQELDFSGFDIDWGIELDNTNNSAENNTDIDTDKYTDVVNIPQYEIKGECPEIADMLDLIKCNELIDKINNSNVTKEQKDFLIYAAYRHCRFTYSKIAEYYAHQSKEMQELMEDSALVIIDYNDALKNGYTKLKNDLDSIREEE